MYEFIKNIMYAGAEIMLEAENIESKIKVKPGDANFVTAYDVAVEKYLIGELSKKLPEAQFIGEEEAANPDKLAGKVTLIIDPIDGTTNFIHRRRYSAISIGVCDDGEMVYGGIYDPYSDRLYEAEKGCGAKVTINKETTLSLKMQSKPLKDCLSAFGTSPYYRDELGKKTFDTAYKMFMNTREIRRSGSAALDLAAVASGEIDIFFEYRLSPWDFAAGSLIVEEAGGVITDMDGGKIGFGAPTSVLCGNPQAHAEWLELNKG